MALDFRKFLDPLSMAGKFREELAYRLQGMRLRLPPLRERLEDLPLLIEHFLELAKARCGVQSASIRSSAMEILWAFPWPGNIRQLQHVLEGAPLIAENGVIRPEHLPPALREALSRTLNAHSLDEVLAEKEREAIVAALQQAGGIQAKAAKLLGISERSLWYRTKSWALTPRAQK